MKFVRPAGMAFTAIIILLLFAGCTNTTSSTTTPFTIPANFTNYTDDTSLFAVSYPNTWEQASTMTTLHTQIINTINNINAGLPIKNSSVLLVAGLKATTGYYPNINVGVDPAPTGMTTNDQAVQAEIASLKKSDPNCQVVSQPKTLVSGKDAVIIEFKATFSGSPLLLHDYMLVCLTNGNIWTLSCTAKETDFTQLSGDFNIILKSFKINK
jgi:hypothetical protein